MRRSRVQIPQAALKPAHVVKLVDTLSSGGSAARHGGSSPLVRTNPGWPKGPGIFYSCMPELAHKHAGMKKSARRGAA
jgi:hypothetical protein